MAFYICYANEDRLQAIRLNNQLKVQGYTTHFIDRGDTAPTPTIDPIENIMHAIEDSKNFVVVHSEHTNTSVLSQLEITYAKNRKLPIFVIQTSRASISSSIQFELGNSPIIKEKDMTAAVKRISTLINGDN